MSVVLVGGVAQLYQGDLDAGRLAVERLQQEALGPGVLVEDLSYGAVAVMQRLEDLRPAALVLVAAEERGRPPGTVERRRLHDPGRSADEVQTAVWGAVTGYVGVDLLVDVASGFGALPARTVAIEIEPASRAPSTELTAEGQAALERALALVRLEAERLPVLALADDLRPLLEGDRLERTRAVSVLRRLLDALAEADESGDWTPAFALRDRLRDEIAGAGGPEGMSALDWGLWWTLIEALDRLQPEGERIRTESSSNGGSSSKPRL